MSVHACVCVMCMHACACVCACVCACMCVCVCMYVLFEWVNLFTYNNYFLLILNINIKYQCTNVSIDEAVKVTRDVGDE